METDILLRLVAATTIGISHDLSSKPTGMHTLGLVSLGAALVTLGTARLPMITASPDALSRVIQGAIQRARSCMEQVQGFTTAASVSAT